MSIYTVNIPTAKRCCGCIFYQQNGDDWSIGKCTNAASLVRTKDPRFATDRSCVQKITRAGIKRVG